MLTIDSLLTGDTLLVDLALLLLAIGVWMELKPRQPVDPPETAGRMRQAGAVPAMLLLAITMLPESSFWSSPGRALLFFLVFAALAWRQNALLEARHRAA